MNLRPITLLGIITSMVTGVTLGVMLSRSDRPSTSAATFAAVMDHVAANYVDEVPREQLLDNALRGMVDGLDAHSRYLEQDYYDELETDATGQFSGIGIELGLVDGFFTVIAPMELTPAAEAGVQAGDRLIAVNGASLKGKRLSEVIASLRGRPGSSVSLTLVRAGSREVVSVQRADIHVPSVHPRMLEPGYAYMRISRFHRNTHANLLSAVRMLDDDPRGLVLDLRDNPGGLLGASVDVSSEFLDGGLVVYTRGREDSDRQEYRAAPSGTLSQTPVIVLIDGGTASAAEIVAGALRDRGRARLMGSRTFGKGSVQSVLPLPGRKGLKLTTAHYYTPSGAAIHGEGIEPHIAWEGDPDELVEAALRELRANGNPQPSRVSS